MLIFSRHIDHLGNIDPETNDGLTISAPYAKYWVDIGDQPCVRPRWPLGLGWANLDEAVKNYEKAISLRSQFIMYRLDCARAYVELDEYDKARTHLTTITTLPTMDEDDGQFRKDAQELLEKIKGK